MSETQLAFAELRKYKKILTRKEMSIIKGQLKSGQVTAAMKGLNKVLSKKGM